MKQTAQQKDWKTMEKKSNSNHSAITANTENTDKNRCFSPVFITLVYFRYLLTEVY